MLEVVFRNIEAVASQTQVEFEIMNVAAQLRQDSAVQLLQLDEHATHEVALAGTKNPAAQAVQVVVVETATQLVQLVIAKEHVVQVPAIKL